MSIAAVVLAAGDSSRMGCPKALLPLRDTTFLGTILDTLETLQVPSPLVVLGKHAAVIEPHIARRNIRVLVNPRPERGQLSSLQLALGQLPESRGCLVWPIDHPAVPGSLVRDLMELFAQSRAPLVLPVWAGRRGHPGIFGNILIAELLALPAEQSPKDVIGRYREETALLETDCAEVAQDVDTPEDYRRLCETIRQRR
jgi:molybdenum cofactor cytidylyltransferase